MPNGKDTNVFPIQCITVFRRAIIGFTNNDNNGEQVFSRKTCLELEKCFLQEKVSI